RTQMPRRRDVVADGTLATRSCGSARCVDTDGRTRPALCARVAARTAARMTTPRVARMEALFHAALERPAAERSAFLAAAETDTEVRASVERLLAHHTGSDVPLRDVLDAVVVDG